MTAPSPLAALVERVARKMWGKDWGMLHPDDKLYWLGKAEIAVLETQAAAALSSTEALLRRAGEVLKPFAAIPTNDLVSGEIQLSCAGGLVTIADLRAARTLANDLAKREGK